MIAERYDNLLLQWTGSTWTILKRIDGALCEPPLFEKIGSETQVDRCIANLPYRIKERRNYGSTVEAVGVIRVRTPPAP